MWMRFCITGLLIVSLLTSKQIAAQQFMTKHEQQLFSLIKTYGYIRYFYPGDEAASLDWDRLAFHLAKSIMTSGQADVAKQLNDIFQLFAPGIQVHRPGANYNSGMDTIVKDGLFPVYWQHIGDGNGKIGYPYQSMRVNRMARVLPQSQNDFSGIRKSLDAAFLAGKEIRLRTLFKTDAFYNGILSIVIRIQEKNKTSKLISSAGQAISSTKWLEHSITTKVPDTVEAVTVFVQSIQMAGSTLIDQLTVEVKENNEWKSYVLADFSRLSEKEFSDAWRPYGDNHEIAVVKDQDKAMVRIIRTQGKLQEHAPLFDKYPKAKEVLHKQIGNNLQLSFPILLMGDKQHTYPVADIAAVDHLNNELNDIPASELTAGNLYVRIANVMILWNRMQHFYPEMRNLKINWDLALKKAIHACFADSTEQQHRISLAKMLADLKDSHMTIYYTSLMQSQYFPPFMCEWIENNMVVTGVFDSSIIMKPGDIVIKVNGVKATEYWKEKKMQALGVTESRKNFKTIFESLEGIKGSVVDLVIRSRDGVLREVTLKRTIPRTEFDRLVQTQSSKLIYTEVAPGIQYINLNKITWAELEKEIPEMANAKGLIFDLREYPAWNTIKIIAHFIKQPVYWFRYSRPYVIYPDQQDVTYHYETVDTILPASPFLPGRKVFLTGGGAISYAEDFGGIVAYYKLADLVGEPTAGSTSNINMCYLLGGLYTPWTGQSVLWQNGKRFNATSGIIPNHLVQRTIKGAQAGRDEYLEYALAHIFKISTNRKR